MKTVGAGGGSGADDGPASVFVGCSFALLGDEGLEDGRWGFEDEAMVVVVV